VPPPLVPLKTRVPQELYDELVELAANYDRSVSYLVRQAVEQFVEDARGVDVVVMPQNG
jgi:predicted DNA-binding protein